MNLNKELHSIIFKRKSFHLFRNIGDIKYEVQLYTDNGADEEKTLNAVYKMFS